MPDLVADIQNHPDIRNLPVNKVGIRGIRHPIHFEDRLSPAIGRQPAVANFDMLVDLPKNVKGTHMSRFIEMLNEQEVILSIPMLSQWVATMTQRLGAEQGFIKAQFTLFIKKYAPISKIPSLLDYEIILEGYCNRESRNVMVTVIVPVTSLCPCSKEIADYGAHNQRSHVTVTVIAKPNLSLAQLIQLVESKASCELYGILKRTDEKYITERAYDNPKFVEDMVRDVATALETLPTIQGYKVCSENFESIHNHSAYAEIDKLPAAKPATVIKKVAIEQKTVSEIT